MVLRRSGSTRRYRVYERAVYAAMRQMDKHSTMRLLKRWNLGAVASVEPIQSYWRGSKAITLASGHRFVLKRINPKAGRERLSSDCDTSPGAAGQIIVVRSYESNTPTRSWQVHTDIMYRGGCAYLHWTRPTDNSRTFRSNRGGISCSLI